mgnify:CR=1 FL=1
MKSRTKGTGLGLYIAKSMIEKAGGKMGFRSEENQGSTFWFSIPFAEEKFGPGGTRFFYKLIGILTVFIGIFISTNIISSILESLAGILTNT